MKCAHILAHAVLAGLFCLGQTAIAQPVESTDTGSDTSSTKVSLKVKNIQGPVFRHILADMCILEYQGTYYSYATNAGEYNVPFAKSQDKLSGWTLVGDAMPTKSGVGKWANDTHGLESKLWAPDVSRLEDGRFILYYAAVKKSSTPPKGNQERCIGVAYAKTPLGPFIPKDEPFFCPEHAGTIDPSAILDGKDRYVVVKDGSKTNNMHLALFKVDPKDGFTKLTPDPVFLTDQPKGKGFEGPTMTKMPNGRWLLLHTTGQWFDDYAVNWALSDSGKNIDGKYTDRGVLLGTEGKTVDGKMFYRPGGPDFLGTSNTDFFFFAEEEKDSKARYMYHAELEYS